MRELITMRKTEGSNKICTSNAGEYNIYTADYNGDMISIMSVYFCPTLRDGNDNGVFDTDLLEIARDKLKKKCNAVSLLVVKMHLQSHTSKRRLCG